MNITKEAWNKYIATIAKLDEKAASMIKDWVNANGHMNRDALIDYTFNVVQTLSLGSGALAVDWYEAVAQLEGVVIPGAEIAELPTYGDVAKTVNGVMKRSLNADTIASAASMLVKRTAADTTLYNAKRDGAEFAWIPVGDTCPFCMQLASYGWRRASEKTVKGDHAEHIHPNCDCEFAIRFGDDLKYSSYDPDKYKEIYENAEGDTVAEKRNSIRRMQYQENKDRINAQKRAAYAERKLKDIGMAASAKIDEWIDALPADARDKFSKIIKRGTEPMKHGFSCYGDKLEDRIMASRASKIQPEEGFFDVSMHGTPTAVCFGSDQPNMSPRLLANIIKNNPDYHGENIRLFCCSTGELNKLKPFEYCFAEELANNLGVRVDAPDDVLYIRTDGSWFVGKGMKEKLISFEPNHRGRYK